MTTTTKGAPTKLNLSVLRETFAHGVTVPNAIDAASAPHLRRCAKAGLLAASADGRSLFLTVAGCAAIGVAS